MDGRSSNLGLALLLTLLVVSLPACGSSDRGPDLTEPVLGSVPAFLFKIAGDRQEGTVATRLRGSLVIRVTDAMGRAVPDVPVDFHVSTGGGWLTTGSTIANGEGFAFTGWVLGTEAGVGHAVTASVDLDDIEAVLFTATATAGPGLELIPVSGNRQTGTAGLPLNSRLILRVVDRFGNPVESQIVKFLAEAGADLTDPRYTTTNSDGLSRSVWTLSVDEGRQFVQVWSPGLNGSPSLFEATALAP